MDIIAKALHRAKTGAHFGAPEAARQVFEVDGAAVEREPSLVRGGHSTLSSVKLLSKHIVAQDSGHRITRSYDVLRGQLTTLNEGRTPGILAVTAPTAGCGTTTSAINLAFSFARTRDANVLLIDANFRSPSVKTILGQSVVPSEDEAQPSDLQQLQIDGLHLNVFAPRHDIGPAMGRSDITQLSRQIDAVRRSLNPSITILDLPPLLTTDETASLAANADTVLVVLAVGRSKVAELEMCKTYLDPRSKVQVVLNKCRRHGL